MTPTHPPVWDRAKQIHLLLKEKNATHPPFFDAILDLSTRVKEEQVFRTSTGSALKDYLEDSLGRVDFPIAMETRKTVASAILGAAIGLPKIDEDAIVSLQFDGKQYFRVVRYDPHAAIAATAGAVGGLLGATSTWAIGAAVVAVLASLKSVSRELSATEGAILYSLYRHHPTPVSRAVLWDDVTIALARTVDRAAF